MFGTFHTNSIPLTCQTLPNHPAEQRQLSLVKTHLPVKNEGSLAKTANPITQSLDFERRVQSKVQNLTPNQAHKQGNYCRHLRFW